MNLLIEKWFAGRDTRRRQLCKLAYAQTSAKPPGQEEGNKLASCGNSPRSKGNRSGASLVPGSRAQELGFGQAQVCVRAGEWGLLPRAGQRGRFTPALEGKPHAPSSPAPAAPQGRRACGKGLGSGTWWPDDSMDTARSGLSA